ncbi:hypothetical protein BOVATA_036040 [Babesia ovata]|uniref:Uncharacterized protein n=1 Tax=Babesia ovata TaxID=189622 RepID=A0A2H6KGK3_9APIC|nr:uncharacterized protein BOVATA_036040 [Babesia ovata]GBE62111.1 hypothetical protein BOVATA_036040 [Babesia ovata]
MSNSDMPSILSRLRPNTILEGGSADGAEPTGGTSIRSGPSGNLAGGRSGMGGGGPRRDRLTGGTERPNLGSSGGILNTGGTSGMGGPPRSLRGCFIFDVPGGTARSST